MDIHHDTKALLEECLQLIIIHFCIFQTKVIAYTAASNDFSDPSTPTRIFLK